MRTSPIANRSITIEGHKTSVSLERDFWNALKLIAVAKGQTVSKLIAAVDCARPRNASLSSCTTRKPRVVAEPAILRRAPCPSPPRPIWRAQTPLVRQRERPSRLRRLFRRGTSAVWPRSLSTTTEATDNGYWKRCTALQLSAFPCRSSCSSRCFRADGRMYPAATTKRPRLARGLFACTGTQISLRRRRIASPTGE